MSPLPGGSSGPDDREIGAWFVGQGAAARPEAIAAVLRRHASRMPPRGWEDFLSMVAIEWIEETRARPGRALDERDVDRVADRVRHRLMREARRRRDREAPVGVGELGAPDESRAEWERDELVEELGARLSGRQAAVLAMLLSGHTHAEIARGLGASPSTIARDLRAIRDAASKLLGRGPGPAGPD